MKNQMAKRCYTFLILLLTYVVSHAEVFSLHESFQVSQGVTISGTVLDSETKEPLAGATVMIKGTTVGTTADVDGKYLISTDKVNTVLVVSFVGYSTVESPVDNRRVINFELKPSSLMSLEEVVVVGYGTRKKANVVGAVTTLKGSDIKSIPATSVTNALAGRLPGVVAIQKNGEPGNLGSRLMVRGRSTLGGGRKHGTAGSYRRSSGAFDGRD